MGWMALYSDVWIPCSLSDRLSLSERRSIVDRSAVVPVHRLRGDPCGAGAGRRADVAVAMGRLWRRRWPVSGTAGSPRRSVEVVRAGCVASRVSLRPRRRGSTARATHAMLELAELQQAAGANEIITYSQDPVLRKDGEDFEARPGLRPRTGWRLRSRRSVTVRMDPKVGRTLTTIDEDSWVPIKYLRRADRQLDLRRRDH